MKIACVYDVVYPYVIGGVQKRNWEIATRLARKGHDVTLFGMKHWEGDAVFFRDGVRLWGVCPPMKLFVAERRSVREAISFAWRVLPPLMQERYDIVEVANFPYFPCFSSRFASAIRRSRFIITWHEIWDNYWYEYLGKKGAFGKLTEQIVAKSPHQPVAISQHTKKALEKLGRKGALIVPCGADIRLIDSAPSSTKSADIIFVGRLTPQKNVGLLIRAVNRIKEKGKNASCLIIGDGPDNVFLHSLVQELGLTANVRFLARVETDIEVFSYMKGSGVLVHPSTREGFGTVIVEANACGIPVVTVRHPLNAAQDLVVDGQNGFTSDLSVEDIADKILMALDGNGIRKERCKELAREYDWDVIADSAEQVYQAR
jgi:glycosyltransferase involved in cell wall biosynthesis